MIAQNFNSYVESNTKSLLVKSFVAFLFKERYPLNEEDYNMASKNLTDYKNVAALGFMMSIGTDLKGEFSNGMTRQMGRQIDESHNMIFDNVAILGIILGLKECARSEALDWVSSILKIKSRIEKEDIYHRFFLSLIEGKVPSLDNKPVTDLDIFLSILIKNDIGDIRIVTNYFNKHRVGDFPYSSDLMLNLITVFNTDWIIATHSLTPSGIEFYKKQGYEFAQNELARTFFEDYNLLKVRIEKLSVFLAKAFFLLIIIFLTTTSHVISRFVLNIDWDSWEPVTYVFHGILFPIISYCIIAIYFLFTGTDNFWEKIKPKNVYLRIKLFFDCNLYKLLGFNMRLWQNLYSKSSI